MRTKPRRRTFSAGVRIAVLVAAMVGVVGGASLRAEAATYPTWGSTASQVGTWLDSTGRLQAAWVSHLAAQQQGTPDTWELLTVRQNLAGQPDPTWGTDPYTGEAGVRRTALVPPPGSSVPDHVDALSTDAGGNITIAWTMLQETTGDSCESDVEIDEVIVDHYTPDGSRASRTATNRHQNTTCSFLSSTYTSTVVPLTDGSVAMQELTQVNNTVTSSKILWVGSAGNTRAAFPISVEDPTYNAAGLIAASTNGDGRLYVTTTDGLLRRTSSAGGVDQSIPSTCRFDQSRKGPLLPVAGPGGSFAAVCGTGDAPPSGNPGVEVRRYGADGALTSTITSLTSASNTEVSRPTTGAFDSTGRLWVGGPACTYSNGAVHCYRGPGLDTGAVSAFDATHKVDSLSGEANQVDGLRSIGNGRIAFGMPGTAFNGANRVYVGLAPTPAPPAAKAGADQTVGSGQAFTLDGSSSTGDSPTFQWVQISGPATTIQNPRSARTSVAGKAGPATLTYRLTVTDSAGRTSTDDVIVTVRAPK